MTGSPSNIVQIKDYLPLPSPPPRQKSQYERFPLPFFNAEASCTWDVKPTGNYGEDCETGEASAPHHSLGVGRHRGRGRGGTQGNRADLSALGRPPLASPAVFGRSLGLRHRLQRQHRLASQR